MNYLEMDIQQLIDTLLKRDAEIQALRKDAERWRCARDLLSIDDIDTAADNMRGSVPDPDESAKADAAIDAAIWGGQ